VTQRLLYIAKLPVPSDSVMCVSDLISCCLVTLPHCDWYSAPKSVPIIIESARCLCVFQPIDRQLYTICRAVFRVYTDSGVATMEHMQQLFPALSQTIFSKLRKYEVVFSFFGEVR